MTFNVTLHYNDVNLLIHVRPCCPGVKIKPIAKVMQREVECTNKGNKWYYILCVHARNQQC